jgi:hypothetical protein
VHLTFIRLSAEVTKFATDHSVLSGFRLSDGLPGSNSQLLVNAQTGQVPRSYKMQIASQSKLERKLLDELLSIFRSAACHFPCKTHKETLSAVIHSTKGLSE